MPTAEEYAEDVVKALDARQILVRQIRFALLGAAMVRSNTK